MARVGFPQAALVVALAGAAIVAVGRFRRGASHVCYIAACCTTSVGFLSIGLEILLLLAFQAIYGSVYQQLAIVIGAFMAGMALGSWLALRPWAGRGIRALAWLQTAVTVAPLVLLGFFSLVSRVSGFSTLFIIGHLVFPGLALVSGLLGGYEFPLACRLYAGPGRKPVLLYAMDLAGSCAGAMLFSAYLIPVFGFLRTALLMAIVGLAPAALAMAQPSTPHPAG
jgi:predicted membrane-bound spermidine synthase